MTFIERCKTYYASVGISEEIIRTLVVPSFQTVIVGDWECEGIYMIDSVDTNDEDDDYDDYEDEDVTPAGGGTGVSQ